MQTAISINQRVAIENELSLPEAAIFAYFWNLKPNEPGSYLYQAHRVWFPATPESVAKALPLVDYAPKTVQHALKKLIDAGLIERKRDGSTTYYSITEKGRAW